jgi:hypothetical protein
MPSACLKGAKIGRSVRGKLVIRISPSRGHAGIGGTRQNLRTPALFGDFLAQLRPFVKTPTKRATKLSYRAPACARVALAADSGSGGGVVSRQGLHHVWVEVDRELGLP